MSVPTSSASSVGVVLAHDDRAVAEQVTESLEQVHDLFVAATSLDATTGAVVVAGGDALVRLQPQERPVIALAAGDLLRAARAALAVHATDLIRWPEEADRLPSAIRRAIVSRTSQRPRGQIVAVAGARGGLGTSTFAALLARSLGALVVDLDGGQRAFIDQDPPRTIDDIRSACADLTAEAFDAALGSHAAGVRALHAGAHGGALSASSVHGLLRAVREASSIAVIDVGRCTDDGARTAMVTADVRVLIVGDDVSSVRGAQRIRAAGGGELQFVIRKRGRGGVAPRDLRSALTADPIAVLRNDANLARATDLGTLPARPTRTTRAAATVAKAVRA